MGNRRALGLWDMATWVETRNLKTLPFPQFYLSNNVIQISYAFDYGLFRTSLMFNFAAFFVNDNNQQIS